VPKLNAFLGVHSKLQLELVMDDRFIDLVAENIDVAIRPGTITDSSLKARKLAQGERLVVASPAYLARRGVPLTPADLNQQEAIVYSQRSRARNGLSVVKLRKFWSVFRID
jgi:DNA-binding transcriptional LysR family regulator